MEKWTTSLTSNQVPAFISSHDLECQETVETYEGKDIEKVVMERTSDGKVKSIRIDFVV